MKNLNENKNNNANKEGDRGIEKDMWRRRQQKAKGIYGTIILIHILQMVTFHVYTGMG